MFDNSAVRLTTKLAKEKNEVPCLLVNPGIKGIDTEMFRFLIPIVGTTEEWSNSLKEVTPYKRYSLVEFEGRGSDKLSLDVIMTTRSRSKSIQPLLDKLKSCMIPQAFLDSKKDDVNPPKLNLFIGDITYKNLYLSSVKIKVTERHNGFPIYAELSLSFISSFIEVK